MARSGCEGDVTDAEWAIIAPQVQRNETAHPVCALDLRGNDRLILLGTHQLSIAAVAE